MSSLLLTGKRTLPSSLLPSFPKTHARLTRKYDVRSREFLNLRKIRRELRGTINLCQRGIDMEDIRYEFDKSPGKKSSCTENESRRFAKRVWSPARINLAL